MFFCLEYPCRPERVCFRKKRYTCVARRDLQWHSINSNVFFFAMAVIIQTLRALLIESVRPTRFKVALLYKSSTNGRRILQIWFLIPVSMLVIRPCIVTLSNRCVDFWHLMKHVLPCHGLVKPWPCDDSIRCLKISFILCTFKPCIGLWS